MILISGLGFALVILTVLLRSLLIYGIYPLVKFLMKVSKYIDWKQSKSNPEVTRRP